MQVLLRTYVLLVAGQLSEWWSFYKLLSSITGNASIWVQVYMSPQTHVLRSAIAIRV